MDQEISDTKPSANVDLIAVDIDFKPYLEAAKRRISAHPLYDLRADRGFGHDLYRVS